MHASILTAVSREAKEEAASHTPTDSSPYSCINYCNSWRLLLATTLTAVCLHVIVNSCMK